jgi:hypothetical protein
MHYGRNIVKPSIREILAKSHVAAIAIALLLVWSVESLLWSLWRPLYRVCIFLITAVSILGVPSDSLTEVDRLMVVTSLAYLFSALCCVAAAWLLSRWVYGAEPLRSLMRYRTSVAGRDHA